MKKMKNDNKGFTLVELIVVLVILAILAAILVPALLGYIDEAKQKQIVLEGKSVYTAAQALASEAYAKDKDPKDIDTGKILDMADVRAKCTGFTIGFERAYDTTTTDTAQRHQMYTVKYVKYSTSDGDIYLSDGTWSSSSTKEAVNPCTYTKPTN